MRFAQFEITPLFDIDRRFEPTTDKRMCFTSNPYHVKGLFFICFILFYDVMDGGFGFTFCHTNKYGACIELTGLSFRWARRHHIKLGGEEHVRKALTIVLFRFPFLGLFVCSIDLGAHFLSNRLHILILFSFYAEKKDTHVDYIAKGNVHARCEGTCDSATVVTNMFNIFTIFMCTTQQSWEFCIW